MPILHLGVIDIPYNEPPSAPEATKTKNPRKPLKVAVGTEMTGDVAGWLENKYHVMEHFFELHGDEIAKSLENSLAGSLETMLMGGPATDVSFASAESDMDQMFRDFLTNKELDALGYPGIPTQAAIDGVNPRFKGGKGPKNRPSFVASGTYQSSFKAWIDDKKT